MDIIVTQIKQIGREILLDGNSVVGYQHLANLYIKLIKDTSADNPFANMALSAYCRGWKSRMPVSCPIVEKEDGTFILLKNEVFKEDGDVYLSLGGISEDKVIVTSNNLVLQVDESNSIIANVTPSEEYWQIEVLNAMKAWYANVVDPIFKDSETKLNQLIRISNATDVSIFNANIDKIAKGILNCFGIGASAGAEVKPTTSTKKNIEEIAREVIAGKWGNGSDRQNRLTAARYDYNLVQAKVNKLCGVSGASKPTTTTKKTNAQIAQEIYNGTCSDSRWSDWGNEGKSFTTSRI